MKMKRIACLLVAMFFVTWFGKAQTEILVGEGETTFTDYLPFSFYEPYSYDQTIYLAEELIPGTITSISYEVDFINALTDVPVTVLLGEVSRDRFYGGYNTTDFVPADSLTQVFAGNVSFPVSGWVTITFDQPFVYSGNNNLVVATTHARGVEGGSGYDYRSKIHSTNRSIISVGYDFALGPQTPTDFPGGGNSDDYEHVPVIKFMIDNGDNCLPIQGLSVVSVTSNSATVSWNVAESTTDFIVEYKGINDAAWLSAGTTADTSIVVSGLESLSTYVIRVTANCTTGSSPSREITVLTDPSESDIYMVPFEEDFDTPSDKWVFANSVINAWYIGTAENFTVDSDGLSTTNGSALYVSNDAGAHATYSFAPESKSFAYAYVNFPQATNFELSFDWKCAGEGTYDAFSVYLLPIDTEIDTNYSGTDRIIDYTSGNISKQHKSVLLPGTYNGAYKLVFEWKNDYSAGLDPSAVIDNLKIRAFNCSNVTDVVVTPTQEDNVASATVSFTDNNNNSESMSYLIQYRPQGSTEEWTTVNVNTTTAQISGLSYSSAYELRVMAICNNDADTSLATDPVYFRTLCGPISQLPWNEDFSEITAPQVGSIGTNPAPFCWYNINAGAGSNNNYFDFRNESVYYQGVSSNTERVFSEWLISPLFNLTGGERLNFDMKQYNSGVPVYVEVYGFDASMGDMTVAADTASFVLIDRITILNYSSEYERYELSLGQFEGAARFAFVVREDCGYFNIDNVSVSAMSECPDVYQLSVAPATSTSVKVDFSTSNATANGWVVAYAQVETSADFNPNTATQVTVASAEEVPVIIDNLAIGSTYFFAVKHNCPTAMFCTPDSLVVSEVVSLPYTQNFDNSATVTEYTTTWDGMTENRWYVGNAVNNTTDNANGGALYISNNAGAGNEYNNGSATDAFAVANIHFGEGLSFSLDFDWRAMAEGNYDYLRVYMLPIDANIVLSDAYALTPKLSNQAAWQHESITLLGEYANTTQKLVFYWRNDNRDGNNPPAAVDNVSIVSMNCASVEQVSLTFVEGETPSLVVNVTDNNTDATYLVEYKEQGASSYTTFENVTMPYTITGVDYTTTYEVRVAAVCGTEQTGFTTASITTPCQSMSIPWVEPFDMTPIGSECWAFKSGLLPMTGTISLSNLSTTSYGGWTYDNYTALGGTTSGKLAANIYSNSQYWAVTPPINLGDGSTIHQLAIDVALTAYGGSNPPQAASDDKFMILVSTDNGTTWSAANALIYANGDADAERNYSDFTITPTRVVYKLVDSENNPYSGSVRFAFYGESTESNGDNMLFIDNIAVTEWSACQAPYNVNVASLSANSASVTFQHDASITNFEYVLTTATTPEGQTPIAISTNTIELSDLTPITQYNVFVRSLCGENVTSPWSEVSFKTYPAVSELPYATSFSIATDAEQWVSLSSSTNKWSVGSATTSDLNPDQIVEGDMAAYISTDDGVTYSANSSITYAYFFKDLDFADGDAIYTLSFDYKVKGHEGWYGPDAGMKVYLQDISDPLNMTALPSNEEDLLGTFHNQTTWTNFAMELPYTSGEKRLVFLTWGYNQYETTTVPAAIDNISISESYCPKPQDLQITATTSTSITVSWVGFSESYQVTCNPLGSTESVAITTTDDYVTFTELSPAVKYVIKVQGICGADFSIISDSILVQTPCFDGAITNFPYEEGFENGIGCWEQIKAFNYDGTEWDAVQSYQYDYSGFIYPAADGGEYFAYSYPNDYYDHDEVMLISNQMDITILNTPRLSFLHMQRNPYYEEDKLKVYYRTSPSSDWVELLSYTSSIDSWRLDSINLPNPSTTYQIAFKAIGDGGDGVLLDNIKVFEGNYTIEPCAEPTALTVSNVTATSAEISWNGTANNYEIKLSGEAVETETIELLSTNSKTFTDLLSGYTFTVSVRSVCEGNRSQWVTTTFTTLQPIIAPTATTLAATAITHESATLNGTITAGSEEITAQGFMYKATAAADWTTVNATGETISATLTALTAETEYTFKAFATTASGTVEGEAMTFTTTAAPIVAPVVTTLAATEITNATAKLNGTVTAGSEEIVAQGFMYKASNAADWTTVAAVGETMTLTVEGLEAELEYVFKAFATTASGTVEGEELTFTTLAGLNDATAVSIIANVYPNPAEDKATISVNGLMNATKIVVSDMQGRILLSDDMTESTYELNTSNYASGVYYIRIISGNAVNTQKLIVK